MKWLMKVFLTERAEIVNAQDSDKDWYLTSWNKYTDTRVMPSLIIIKVCRDSKEGLHSYLLK